MEGYNGFWSYVHKDDKAEHNRISQMALHLIEQYELLTGESIKLFLDKDAIEWGENWRNKIDDNLSSVAFFIPVMTPRYFMSPECRRELQFFARRSIDLGIKELVLPLFYIDIPLIEDDKTEDDLIKLIKTFQWEDWRDLRFNDISSEDYRRGIARLAKRLMVANRNAEKVEIIDKITTEKEKIEETDESMGILDSMAIAEEASLALDQTMKEMQQDINLIREIFNKTTLAINQGNNQRKGFKYKLTLTRQMAVELNDPVERIMTNSNHFTSQIHDIDRGIRVVINLAVIEAKGDPAAKEKYSSLFEAIVKMSEVAQVALTGVQKLIDSSQYIEKMSRDLRPQIRHLNRGLTTMLEAREVLEEWGKLISESGMEKSEHN